MNKKWFVFLWPVLLFCGVIAATCPFTGWSVQHVFVFYAGVIFKRPSLPYIFFACSMLVLSLAYWFFKPGWKSLIATMIVGFVLCGPLAIGTLAIRNFGG